MSAVFLFSVVFLYAVVQSIFGVGLLVFGTPTLLLLGYSFENTLGLLLPCSLTISLFQLCTGWKELKSFKIEFLKFSLLPLIVALSAVLFWESRLSLRFAVGVMLLLSALLREYEPAAKFAKEFLQSNKKIFLVVLGLVHGATNMGGGLLTLYAASVFDTKFSMRAHIAYGYAVMATMQLLVLLLFGQLTFGAINLMLIGITAATYVLIGNRLFFLASKQVFFKLMTAFMCAFGITLIIF